MTIKEIEALSGMERANIRFYEREGLISPQRLPNGYRDYSEADLQILLRVKLLRSLHISLDEIKALKNGRRDLAETLSRQIEALDREREDAAYAQELCRIMRDDRATFAELDAPKYLDGLNRAAEKTASGYFSVKGDELPQVYHPFRRYFARMLDLSLCAILWSAVVGLAFHVNLSAHSNFQNIVDVIATLILMQFLEPLWLRFFGTTPGKVVFGLKIEAPDGRRLTYAEGLERTWGVIGAGMGYQIPIYSLFRLWKSFKRCTEEEVQPWDESVSYTIRDTKGYRSLVFIGACAALFALFAGLLSAQRLPPNRGQLTVAQFAQNYNYYADYFEIGSGRRYLDESGKWAEKPADATVSMHIELFPRDNPEFEFTLENGFVTGVSFEIAIENHFDWLASYQPEMLLISLAFAAAQNEMGLFSNLPSRIATQVQDRAFSDFSFTEGRVALRSDTDYAGYHDFSDWLIPVENAAETHFSQVFSVSKIN